DSPGLASMESSDPKPRCRHDDEGTIGHQRGTGDLIVGDPIVSLAPGAKQRWTAERDGDQPHCDAVDVEEHVDRAGMRVRKPPTANEQSPAEEEDHEVNEQSGLNGHRALISHR